MSVDFHPHGLDRYLEAQAVHWSTALEEIRAGQKQSHWMWFVFPQLYGLGTSSKAAYYGLRGLAEAEAYAQHPLLGDRLRQGIEAVHRGVEPNMGELFGAVDAMKFLSCLTLFERCESFASLCAEARKDLYDGRQDKRTVALLSGL